MTWTLKSNPAAERRVSKLVEDGFEVDMESHAFRSKLGYNYIDYLMYQEEEEEEI